MIIERIDTVSFIRSLGMKNSFTRQNHTLEWCIDKPGILIDGKHWIPFTNILEAVVESNLVKDDLTTQIEVNYKKAMKKAKGE